MINMLGVLLIMAMAILRLDLTFAFSHTHHQSLQWQPPIICRISTSHLFAGGGFGSSSSKSTSSNKKKKKKTKSKSSGLSELEQVTSSIDNKQSSDNSNSDSGPVLDRFGLPVITEDDIFPPLTDDIIRVPVDASGESYNREQVEDAMKDHLGINLDLFDEHGQSLHSSSTRWKLKMLHKSPPVFRIDNFFTEEECNLYKSMVENDNNKSDEEQKVMQIDSPTFSSHSISRRTSTTWFCRYDAVPTLLAKAQQLLSSVDLCQFEEPQIVRYRNGQEFSWHYDEIPTNQLQNGGQRLATLLVYLNDLEEGCGGGTVFRDLKAATDSSDRKGTQQLTVRPKSGSALLFFPSYKEGTPDIRTLHKGEVALDTKMIAQLWVHEREYQAGVPENNLQSKALDGVEEEKRRLGLSSR